MHHLSYRARNIEFAAYYVNIISCEIMAAESDARNHREHRVLYLGMANDIAQPLLLFPEVEKIYAISLFDSAYCRENTWESQKTDIMHTITTGETFMREECLGSCLPHRGKILRNKDNTRQKCWRLKFNYRGKNRTLIYYYDRNYNNKWPWKIRNINYLLFTASCWIKSIYSTKPKYKNLRNMIQRRCKSEFTLYTLLWDFESVSCHRFDGSIRLNDGRDKDEETELGYVVLRKKYLDQPPHD